MRGGVAVFRLVVVILGFMRWVLGVISIIFFSIDILHACMGV